MKKQMSVCSGCVAKNNRDFEPLGTK
jgi:hypothetical protein